MKKKYMLVIEGDEYEEEIFVKYSSHAIKRKNERAIPVNIINGNILMVGDVLLDELKPYDEFIIIDRDHGESIVGGIDIDDGQITVTIITVIDNSNIHYREGQKIIEL